jgi:pilus assembly protein CpaF
MYQQACDFFIEIQKKWNESNSARFIDEEENTLEKQKTFLQNEISLISEVEIRKRLHAEFFEYGPLNLLFADVDITEILVNSPHSIWFEKRGSLQRHDDSFFSQISYENILERISQKSGSHISLNHPYLESKFLDFRVTLIDKSLTNEQPALSLRRHPKIAWTFERLRGQNWCDDHQEKLIRNLVESQKNFLVVGETGSGKTSVANACLNLLGPQERVITIEDCSELVISNECSLKLLTREDPYGQLLPVTQQDLLRRSLRLRPDRLVMGEIRSLEAKDFLMMLSTGHAGSFATLHAKDPHEALLRLEMLVQLGAPQWSLTAIRRLIFLSLHYILITERTHSGVRRLKNIYRVSSLEESGFTIEAVEDWALEANSSV